MWTERMQKNIKMKYLYITNHFKHTQAIVPLRKHILCELKKYQKNLLKSKI